MSSWPRWVPRPVDLALGVLLTATAQAEIWLVPLGPPAERPLAAVVYAAVLALARHRRAPLVALAVVLTAAAVVPGALRIDPAASLSWLLAVLLVIASAAYHARRPLVALWLTVALMMLAVVLGKGLSWGDIVYGWLLCGGAWVAGRAVGTRTLRAQLAEQRAVMAEREAQARAEAAVAEDRLRIARELHDVVSHGLSVMTLHVGGVRRLLAAEQVRERAVLKTVERTGRESLAEMQRMLGLLRAPAPEAGAPAPGLASLPALLEPLRAAGIDADLTVTGTVRPLPHGLDLAGYRIVQEALTNVLKHAGATRVSCAVHHGPTAVELTVVDDGTGTGSGEAGGHGQVGMRERAALYGGTVEIGRRPGGGYHVCAVLPASEPALQPVRQEAP